MMNRTRPLDSVIYKKTTPFVGYTKYYLYLDALQQLGNEVLSLLQAKAGPTIYFAIYQRVRQQVTKTREERKTKEAILVSKNISFGKNKTKKNQIIIFPLFIGYHQPNFSCKT
jgi:hypothetical protein